MQTSDTITDSRAAYLSWMERHKVTVTFDPAGIDRSNPDRIRFCFRAVVTVAQSTGPSKCEVFNYSGGILAFLPPDFRKRMDSPMMFGKHSRAHSIAEAFLNGRKMFWEDVEVQSVVRRIYDKCKPDAVSLLDSLKMEIPSELQAFEVWADEFGYDKDSRAAEKVWNACRENAAKLRRILSHSAVTELMELEGL